MTHDAGNDAGVMMVMLDRPTFVLQRRANVPLGDVLELVTDQRRFGRGCAVGVDDTGALVVDDPFMGRQYGRHAVWRAHGHLVTARGRRLATVECEVGPWGARSTELLLRPLARHPERWSSLRIRRYFLHAHRCADALTRHFLTFRPVGSPHQDFVSALV